MFQKQSWLKSSSERRMADSSLLHGLKALPPLPPVADGDSQEGPRAKKRRTVSKRPASRRALLKGDDDNKSGESAQHDGVSVNDDGSSTVDDKNKGSVIDDGSSTVDDKNKDGESAGGMCWKQDKPNIRFLV